MLLVATKPTVVYDASVLVPVVLRYFLIHLARKNLFRPRWTKHIADEVIRGIQKYPKETLESAERHYTKMERMIPNCLVTGYEGLIHTLKMPDADDRHVLAAAIRLQSPVIVTNNKRDFPASVLDEFQVEALTADEWALQCVTAHPLVVKDAIETQLRYRGLSTVKLPEFMDGLEKRSGLERSMTALRPYI